MSNILFSRETPWVEKIEVLLIIGIIASIFFPVRYVLENKFSNILGYYSDFTAISIYASFFLVIGFIGIGVYRSLKTNSDRKILAKIFLAFILGLILYQTTISQEYKIISLYYYLRISCVLLLGYYVYKSPIINKYKGMILWAIVIIGAVQSIIALLQFSYQHSLGLNILGESPLSPGLYGVAKVVSHGTKFIRGYGTLPHPNILGAFLTICSIFNLYLLTRSTQKIEKIFTTTITFITILGLFVTFSRAALLAFGIALITWCIVMVLKNRPILSYKKLWIVPIAVLVSIWLFFPWLVSRGNIQDESAVQRSVYNQTGLQILESNWVIGTGPGTNMFHMTQKLQNQLETWNIQPIHNYWLIILSELGILGLFIGVFVLFSLLKCIRDFISHGSSDYKITLLAICLCLLVLLWFDHYFYTIWPAQLMFWTIIGLTWREMYEVSHET